MERFWKEWNDVWLFVDLLEFEEVEFIVQSPLGTSQKLFCFTSATASLQDDA
jgi:hypothetical protein